MPKKKHISELTTKDSFLRYVIVDKLPKDRYKLSFEQLQQELGKDYEALFALTTMLWEQRGIIDESLGKPRRILKPKTHRKILSWIVAGADPDVAVKKELVDLEHWDEVNRRKSPKPLSIAAA
jgi:hypothetical protein